MCTKVEGKNTIKKALKEILYEKPYDSILCSISKNIYEKEFNSNSQVTIEDLGHILEESSIFVFRIFSLHILRICLMIF
ncbi:hypothetical protein [Borrelia persica]|uniref:hypothetical protein n=1 Tax=Borrelia persica TaxID=44448 RepID=UPI0004651D06|nr:hypothetical protein [Borrelia persica]